MLECGCTHNDDPEAVLLAETLLRPLLVGPLFGGPLMDGGDPTPRGPVLTLLLVEPCDLQTHLVLHYVLHLNIDKECCYDI